MTITKKHPTKHLRSELSLADDIRTRLRKIYMYVGLSDDDDDKEDDDSYNDNYDDGQYFPTRFMAFLVPRVSSFQLP